MSYEPSLTDFEIVPSDSIPSITLDNQRRFYIGKSARRLMNVKPYERLAIAYRSDTKELAIIRPTDALDPSIASQLATSQYSVDKRYYMSARYFAKNYGYDEEFAPYFFDYVAGKSDGTLFVFKLRD